MKIFNRDMKYYKAPEESITTKSICLAIISVFVLVVILGKMDEDKTSFVSEQFIKHQGMMK